jgi:hypothetical protein
VVEGSAFSPRPVSVKLDAIAAQATKAANDEAPGAQGAKEQEIEIIFRPDPSVFDGRFANNGWLQELPKPLTKLTWDNAAVISPATAERLGLGYRFGFIGTVAHTDVVELHFQGRVVRAPVWILPGHADNCVTVHLGYGRTRAGRVGTGLGFDAYRLRTSDSLWFGSGLEIRRTAERYPLATTPLRMFLSRQVDLMNDARVVDVDPGGERGVSITMQDPSNRADGTLTLYFDPVEHQRAVHEDDLHTFYLSTDACVPTDTKGSIYMVCEVF